MLQRVCDDIDARGEPADLLRVSTPGVERFEYFRHLERDQVRARRHRG
jgi:hypothetical protein